MKAIVWTEEEYGSEKQAEYETFTIKALQLRPRLFAARTYRLKIERGQCMIRHFRKRGSWCGNYKGDVACGLHRARQSSMGTFAELVRHEC
jgi:hypothetical protein